MRIRLSDVEAETFASPKGRFGLTCRELYQTRETGCPFDIEHVVLPPGKANYPFHAHAAAWEIYHVLSGTATMRTDEETVEIAAGDTYLCRPGLAHQVRNDSEDDVTYLVMTNEVPFDCYYYPDSDKLNPRAGDIHARLRERPKFWQPRQDGADYWTGEE